MKISCCRLSARAGPLKLLPEGPRLHPARPRNSYSARSWLSLRSLGAGIEPPESLRAMQFRAPARQMCPRARFHRSVAVWMRARQFLHVLGANPHATEGFWAEPDPWAPGRRKASRIQRGSKHPIQTPRSGIQIQTAVCRSKRLDPRSKNRRIQAAIQAKFPDPNHHGWIQQDPGRDPSAIHVRSNQHTRTDPNESRDSGLDPGFGVRS